MEVTTCCSEVGVVFLPVKDTQEKFWRAADDFFCFMKDQGVSFPYLRNIPHISLYQMNVSLINLMEVERILSALTLGGLVGAEFSMDQHAGWEGDNIFWRVRSMRKNTYIKIFQSHVVDQLKPLRHQNSPLQLQNRIPYLKTNQRKDVEEYGVYWGLPHNFDPHVTLVYKSSLLSDRVKTILKTFSFPILSFEIGSIALAKLGYYGNVETILWQGE